MGIEHMAKLGAADDDRRLMRFEIADIIRTTIRNRRALCRRGLSWEEEREIVEFASTRPSRDTQLQAVAAKLVYFEEREFAGLDG